MVPKAVLATFLVLLCALCASGRKIYSTGFIAGQGYQERRPLNTSQLFFTGGWGCSIVQFGLTDVGQVWAWSSQNPDEYPGVTTNPLYGIGPTEVLHMRLPARQLNFGTDTVTFISGISAGSQTAFALTDNGGVYSWGQGIQGSLGNQVASTSTKYTPSKISAPVVATRLAESVGVGDGTTVIQFSDGTVAGMGMNNYYQLCETTANVVSVKLLSLTNIRKVVAGDYWNAYFSGNGSIYFCGRSNSGNFANSAATSGSYYSVPIRATLLGSLQFKDFRLIADFGIGLTTANQIYTWGYNMSGEAGVFGASTAPRLVQLPGGHTPVSIHVDSTRGPPGGTTVWAVGVDVSTGQRSLFSWGRNQYDVMTGTSLGPKSVARPLNVSHNTNTELAGKKIAFVTGSQAALHIFTTSGEAFGYPFLLGNTVDTHERIPPNDPIVDMSVPYNGGIWLGTSASGKLYIANSIPMIFVPGDGVFANPAPLALPPGVSSRYTASDWSSIGLNYYNALVMVGNNSIIYSLGLPDPYDSNWTPLSFMQGMNITHFTFATMTIFAAADARDLYFYDFSSLFLGSPGSYVVNMSGVPSTLRWKKLQFSCTQLFDGGDSFYCIQGPAGFMLDNNGSVWAIGKSAPMWSWNPPGGFTLVPTRYTPPGFNSLPKVDIGVGPYGLFLVDSAGVVWGSTDEFDVNPLYLPSVYPITTVSVGFCGVVFLASDGTTWVAKTTGTACDTRLASSYVAEYDDIVPYEIEGLSYRRVKAVFATGASRYNNEFGAIALADLDIDWESPQTRKEVPLRAKYLRFKLIGIQNEDGFKDFRASVAWGSGGEQPCVLARELLTHQPAQDFQPWVVTCVFQSPSNELMSPVGSLGFQVYTSREYTSVLPEYRFNVVPAPQVQDRSSTVQFVSNSPEIRIYGNYLGYFANDEGDDIHVLVGANIGQVNIGCRVIQADGSMISCIPAQPLPVGILRANVSRFGSSSGPANAIFITDPPTILTKSSRPVPYDAVVLRFVVQFIDTNTTDLEVGYFWKADFSFKTKLPCPVISTTAVASSVVEVVCRRVNDTTPGDLGLWQLIKGGAPSRIFEIGAPGNSTRVAEGSTAIRYAASTRTFFIPGEGFGIDPRDVDITLRITTLSKRATFDYSCVPEFVSDSELRCNVNESALPLPTGVMSARVDAFGVDGDFTNLASIVAAPVIITPNPVPVRASNALFVLIHGSNFDPEPAANQVTVSSGTVNCTQFVGAALYCEFKTRPSDGELRATIVAFGGTSGAPTLVAIVQAPPTVTATPDKTITQGATTVTIQGQNFDPAFTNVTLTLRGQFEFNCVPQSGQVSVTQIVCDLAGGATLNVTGSLSAVVFSYGGSSEIPVIVASVEAPPSSFDSSGSQLPAGAQAGIGVAAAVVGLLLIVVAILLVIRMRRAAEERKNRIQLSDEMRNQLNIQASDLTVLNKLGEGSFGAVYLGKYNKQFVAIKRLAASVLSSQIADFFREASLMLSIKQHPNVVRIFGLCQELNNLSLVMEFLSGGSLDGYVANLKEKGEKMDESTLWRIVSGIASGMMSLASQNIVHRDLAARNILLDSSLEPRVSDFGFSRIVGEEKAGKTQATVGPIKWMPPESLQDRSYSEKSDVWAYGVTLLEIVTGEEPYPGKDLLQIATGVRDAGLTPADQIPKDCADYLRELMEMCWAQRPADRPTFADIAAYLDNHMPAGASKRARAASTIAHQTNVTTSKKKDKEKDGKYSEL